LTGIAVSQFLVKTLRTCWEYRSTRAITTTAHQEEQPLVSSSGSWDGSDQHICEDPGYRANSNSDRAPSLSGEGMSANRSGSQNMFWVVLRPFRAVRGGRHYEKVPWMRHGSLPLGSIMDKISTPFSIVLVVLAFVTICTGLVTMAGIFVSLVLFLSSLQAG
jgi:hypothetical protein